MTPPGPKVVLGSAFLAHPGKARLHGPHEKPQQLQSRASGELSMGAAHSQPVSRFLTLKSPGAIPSRSPRRRGRLGYLGFPF